MRDADRPALLELFRLAFQSEPSPEEWAFKYDAAPRRAVSVVALIGGALVGHFGSIGTRYRGASGDVPGAASGDLMTHPSVRALGKSGLFAEMGRVHAELNHAIGIPFDFGFPHERARRIEERLLGCVAVEPAFELHRPIEPPGAFRRLRLRLSRVLRDEPFGAAHDSLARHLHGKPGFRPDRSRDVLNWRLGRPSVPYRTYQALDGRGASWAYAVCRIVGDRALLVDLQTRDDGSGHVADLLDCVREDVLGRATRLSVRLRSTEPLARHLESLGFVSEPSDTVLQIRPFGSREEAEAMGRQLDYRYLDHDIF